uniref:Jekyll 3 n=1 Tax=Elymus villosus TaxID=1316036 RepID=A0A4Y5PW31_9POAL|nr:jekyll 3 [Elymus villosus]
MAARGGKALVLAMLISFLAVQGTLGFDFAACYCEHNKWCTNHTPPSSGRELYCLKKGIRECTSLRCSKRTPSVMPLADAVNTVTDEGSMAVPAGGADRGEFNVAEDSMAAPAGGADHGEFIVAEEDAAP